MSAALAYQEKRRFGRRESTIRGRAIVPGHVSQPFVIRNVSDGGAMLKFDADFIPSRSFRIEIDGTEFVLLCEVCHQGSYGVGVRFMRVSEGAALNRYFQIKPIEGLKLLGTEAPALEPQPALCGVRCLDLRQALSIASTEAALNEAAEDEPANDEPAESEVPIVIGHLSREPENRWKGAALAVWILVAGFAAETVATRMLADAPHPVVERVPV